MNKFYKTYDNIKGLFDGNVTLLNDTGEYIQIMIIENVFNIREYQFGTRLLYPKDKLQLIEDEEEIRQLNKLIVFK